MHSANYDISINANQQDMNPVSAAAKLQNSADDTQPTVQELLAFGKIPEVTQPTSELESIDSGLKRLAIDASALYEQIRLTMHPGTRDLYLPEDELSRYKALEHLCLAAMGGVYAAKNALFSAHNLIQKKQ